MTFKIEQQAYETIPTGEYLASVGDLTLEDGQYGQQVKFNFVLVEDGPHSGRELITWASAKFTPKSKLYGYVRAIVFGGNSIPADYNLDANDLMGKPAKLVVVEEEKEDGRVFSKINAIKPYVQVDPAIAAIDAAGSSPAPVAQQAPLIDKRTTAVPANAQPI